MKNILANNNKYRIYRINIINNKVIEGDIILYL